MSICSKARNRLKSVLPAQVLDQSQRLWSKMSPGPIKSIIKELSARQVNIKKLDALEVFGRDGNWVTIYYADKVRSLEVWEIDPQYENKLRQNFPRADIVITDSFKKIQTTTKQYSFIVVDNPMSNFGEYCEHFELFPHIFRIVATEAILFLNVIPFLDPEAKAQYPYVFNEDQLQRRRRFYFTEHPENIPISEMIEAYQRHAEQAGFKIRWFFSQRRGAIYSLLVKIVKDGVEA